MTQNSIDNIQFVTVNVQRFTASGTYTPTSGMKFCIVECVGGGGGAGGAVATAAGQVSSATGGGGGGYIQALLTAAQVGASKAVVIGTGGAGGNGVAGSNGSATTFGGAVISAGGGDGGAVSAASSTTTATNSAVGGVIGFSLGSAIIVIPGGRGAGSFCNATGNDVIYTGNGGDSHFGHGAPFLMDDSDIGNNTGTGFGSGPKGNGNGPSGTVNTGSDGQDGLCVVTEFI